MSETQPVDLTAFLAAAGYHIGHVGEVPADASGNATGISARPT